MWTRRLVLLAAAMLAGCQEMVLLGTECADDLSCTDAAMPSRADSGTAVVTPPLDKADGGSVDPVPEPGDAAIIVGASAFYPGIRNPSFSRVSGNAGTVGLLNFSLDPSNGTADLDPWRACTPINISLGDFQKYAPNFTAFSVAVSLDTGSGASARTIKPYDGDSFITASFPPVFQPKMVKTPMSQTLATPLEANRHYAFSVRLQRLDPAANYSLEVYGSNTSCFFPYDDPPWGSVTVPAADDWTKVCVPFTAVTAATELLLVPISDSINGGLTGTLAFAIDDIRDDPACATLE